ELAEIEPRARDSGVARLLGDVLVDGDEVETLAGEQRPRRRRGRRVPPPEAAPPEGVAERFPLGLDPVGLVFHEENVAVEAHRHAPCWGGRISVNTAPGAGSAVR